jgi:hypothetical protein
MKHVFSISCAALLSLVLLATGCKKGDEGPAGPAGPAGPNGPQGPKGDTGVANVIYSGWLDATYDAVTNQAGDTLYYYEEDIPAPKLTSQMLNTGELKVYMNAGTAAQPFIIALPFGYEIIPFFEVGNIYLQAADDYSTFIPTGTTAKRNQYRYVLIPGGVPARSGLDLNDYAKVKEAFKIPD